jgi:hypothetical protein
MKTAVYGENNSPDILFLSGWENRIGDSNIGWLIDLLVKDGYKVHVFEFPCNMKDFNCEYLEPVKAYQDGLGPHVILSHSLGGLVAAYCSAQTRSVYLSPWWGLYGGKLRGMTLSLACSLRSSLRMFPIDFTRDEVGDLATDEYWQALPKKVSPLFVREIVKAQKAMPALQHDHVVFCSLKDTIIDLKAIGERTHNIRLYKGHHEFFSSSTREHHSDEILNALKE